MAGSLGTIYGQVKLDVNQAVAAFAALKSSHKDFNSALKSAGGTIQEAGAVTMGAGVAMVAAFGMAVNAAATFEKKMDYVGAINHATAGEMEQVRNKALQLGRDGQFSAGEIADGFVEMAKAGITTKQMIGGMGDAVVNLASAADVKLGTAVEDIVAQLHTYNLTTDQAAHVSDVLAGAMHASVISLDDMSTALKYAGPIANQLGISLDSTADAMAILGKAGIKGSSAGTQLRQIMVSLSGSTKPARKELEALGIITKDGANQFFDASGKAKSLAEIFQILQDHTAGLNQEQQLAAFKMIFNNRALASAAILTKAGAQGFAEMNKEVEKTTAAEVAGKRLDNLKGDIQKLKGSIDTMMIQAGMPFQHFLRQLVQGINKVINAFINMPKGVQSAILWFLLIAGTTLTLMGAFAMIVGTVMKFVAAARELFAAFKFVAQGIKIVGSAMRLLSTTLLTSPIFWIAVAIIAIGVAFYYAYTHSKTFRDIINKIGEAIKTAFFATINWFKGLPKFFEGVWKDITHWFEMGVNWVKKNWDILLAIFTGPIGLIILIVRRFGSQIADFFKGIGKAIVDGIEWAIKKVEYFFTHLPYIIGYVIGFTIGLIVGFVRDSIKWWENFKKECTKAIIDFFVDAYHATIKFFTDMYHDTVKWAEDTYKSFVKWCEDSYHAIIDFFTKLPGEAERWFMQMNVAIIKWVMEAYHSTVKWFSDMYHDVVKFFTDLPGEAERWFTEINVKLYEKGLEAYHTVVNFFSDMVKDVVNFLEKLPNKCGEIIDNVIKAFKDMVSNAFNTAKDFAKGLWDGFKKGLGIASPSNIERAMWAITKVTDTETRRLGTHVRQMKQLAGEMRKEDPAKTAASANTARIQELTKNMKQQALLLQTAAKSLLPNNGQFVLSASGASTGTSLIASPSQTVPGASPGGAAINITVNNPVAERASDSAARKLRTLTAMGAF